MSYEEINVNRIKTFMFNRQDSTIISTRAERSLVTILGHFARTDTLGTSCHCNHLEFCNIVFKISLTFSRYVTKNLETYYDLSLTCNYDITTR